MTINSLLRNIKTHLNCVMLKMMSLKSFLLHDEISLGKGQTGNMRLSFNHLFSDGFLYAFKCHNYIYPGFLGR